MSSPGKFMKQHLQGKEIEIFTSNENEYVHYSDTDTFSWSIITGMFVDYDEASGTIILESLASGKYFYINEFKVEMFWEAGFDILECTKATLTRVPSYVKKKRDIM